LRREPIFHGALTARSQMRRHEICAKGKPTAQMAAPLGFTSQRDHGARRIFPSLVALIQLTPGKKA
jgi:hypothetical protein